MTTFTKLNNKVVIVEATFKRFGKDVKMKGGAKFMVDKLQSFKGATDAQITKLQAEVAELQSVITEIKNNDDVNATGG